jgi:hypothetical protein
MCTCVYTVRVRARVQVCAYCAYLCTRVFRTCVGGRTGVCVTVCLGLCPAVHACLRSVFKCASGCVRAYALRAHMHLRARAYGYQSGACFVACAQAPRTCTHACVHACAVPM